MIAHEGEQEARRRGPRHTLLVQFLALAALVMAAAVPAPAQETEDQPETVAAPQGSDPVLDAQQGEVITVTARKREENLQEVPLAVTVTPGEVLEDTGAPDISVLQSYVPNLAVYAGRNQSTTLTVFLRGIGQADPLWGVDPGVGLYLADVYIARPQGALLDVYDIDRVEVLRGPQGTLYGKNTIGGAIKYVSRAATTPRRRSCPWPAAPTAPRTSRRWSAVPLSPASSAARSPSPRSSGTATARIFSPAATCRTRTRPPTAWRSTGCRQRT
jgi:outer membrane receptor protein involved in Fe transport